MKFQLEYKACLSASADAAFIAGTEPLLWLKEISQWKLLPSQMECFIIPVSRSSGQAGGLFVIFKDAEAAKCLSLLDPYTQVMPGLFIPANSSLVPALSESEQQKLLIWHRQVFHPASGFTGFEKKDELELSALVAIGPMLSPDWSFADPGLPEKPGLHRIQVIQPSAEELMEEFKKTIGLKPLSEIPAADKEDSWLKRLLYNVLFGIVAFFMLLIGLIARLLPSPPPAVPASGSTGSPPRQGWLSKFMDWLESKMEGLEKRRDKELQRLMKMFDKNKEDAIDYAIPLSSQYMNRGKAATPSSRLFKNPFRFNFGGMGGGQSVDGWNVEKYREDLRTRYLRAAENEIEKKDFKRAAYIYAHLLGDYSSAAKVLERGGHYREAAAFYKEHLKDKVAAARCLESGKLYKEAIDIYADLNHDEKVGDLYLLLDQKTAADAYFENHINAQLRANNHRDAARVMKDKMNDLPRAKSTLLDGWSSSYNGESCLKNYFDLVKNDEADNLSKRVKDVYSLNTHHGNKKQFLNVLEYIHKGSTDAEANFEAQEIAYEIVCERAATGDNSLVNYLERFFPGDKLISGDSLRYMTGDKNTDSSKNRITGNFYLDSSIRWFLGVWHRDQFLVLGRKKDILHLARVNYEGTVEYFSWTNPIPQGTWFRFISNPFMVNTIFLYTSTKMPIEKKAMLRSKDFKEYLLIGSPDWLRVPQCVFSTARDVTFFESQDGVKVLNEYRISGEQTKSTPCVGDAGNIPQSAPLAFHNGQYYTHAAKSFIWIEKKGYAIVEYYLDSVVRLFTISQHSHELVAVISTNRGCFLYTNESKTGGYLLPDVFAEALVPAVICFISGSFFVIAETKTAHLFEYKSGRIVPNFIEKFTVQEKIISIVTGVGQNEFFLISQNGVMTKCVW
jgi:hypothetical protein